MFGRLLSFEPDATGVTVKFEHKEGRISFITDRIVRVYSSMEEKHRPSRAVVQEPKKVDFQARQQKEFITIKTKKLLVRVRDEFQVDFLTPDGRMISEQTARTTKKQEITAQQAELLAKEGHELPKKQSDHTFEVTKEQAELLAKEGHSLPKEKEAHKFEVVRMLHPKEHIYGLGDKTGFLDKRGYAYEMWNSDIPDTHTDFFPSLYKSVPFFISMRPHFTYGIFLDNTSKSYFDMGKEEAERYYFAADGGDLDYYFIAGETMRDILGAYTGLTGRTALPQKWTLGYHQSRWGYITEDDIMDVAEKMRQCRIPCDSIHFDIDYMDAFKVFTWNRKNYKDPKKTLQKLTEMGYKPVTIIDPGVKKEDGYDVYEEGIKNGYFAFSAENELYVNEVWPGDAVFPSFTNPKVRSWWADKQKFLIDMGVRGVWNDMNEPASFKGPLPDDVQFADEDDTVILHKDAHNIYGHCMAMATKDGWLKYDGRRPFIITRAAYAGTQRYALVWTGDNQSIWAHLQMAIPQLCNLGLSGFSYAGTDVGGFGADTTKELLARWVQVGCLSPFFRNHSAQGTRKQEPWQFDKELLEIYRKYVELRYHLLPYIYDCFFESEQTGLPIMRPLMLNFEKDAETYEINDEFMVGEWLLAAPVVTQGTTMRLVYLPEGAMWYDFWTGEKYKGGQYITKKAPLDTMPLFVRAGAVLPLYPLMQYVGEKEVEDLTLAVYPGIGNYIHYQDDGESFAYKKGGYNAYVFSQNNGRLQIKDAVKNYEKPYKGFYVKICRDGVTALSETPGEYLNAE